MPIIVNVHEAKTHFSKLLDQAHAGREIILAKAGTPYARLVPLEKVSNRREPGRWKGRLSVPDDFLDPLPEEQLKPWEEGL
jgi:prevent-host-death family protein